MISRLHWECEAGWQPGRSSPHHLPPPPSCERSACCLGLQARQILQKDGHHSGRGVLCLHQVACAQPQGERAAWAWDHCSPPATVPAPSIPMVFGTICNPHTLIRCYQSPQRTTRGRRPSTQRRSQATSAVIVPPPSASQKRLAHCLPHAPFCLLRCAGLVRTLTTVSPGEPRH